MKPELFQRLSPFVIIAFILIWTITGKFYVALIITAAAILLYINKNKLTSISRSPAGAVDINALKYMSNIKHVSTWVIGGIFVLWLLIASITVIDAGETGVYSLFGKVKDKELSSGLHLVIPLAKVTKMNIKTQDYTMSNVIGEGNRKNADAIAALTKEGLDVNLDITVLYRLNEPNASDIYKSVGVQYGEIVLRPAIRTVIRDVIAQYNAKDIYSEQRESASTQIFDRLQTDLNDRGIIIEQVLLRNVELPNRLTQSIQEKLQAEQEAQKYDFLLETERKEKERKVIEAEGQRDAQQIINQSLSTNYLYYLYINQLKDLEGTVYVPTSPSTGMPLFRNIGQ